MFKRLGPNKVQHGSGFIVRITDRYTIEYRENGRLAKITVDIGIPTLAVFRDTLTPWILADGTTIPMTETERLRVLDNIGQGLAFMDVKVKWYDGPSP
jgi:hypothetical protein